MRLPCAISRADPPAFTVLPEDIRLPPYPPRASSASRDLRMIDAATRVLAVSSRYFAEPLVVTMRSRRGTRR